MNVHIVCSGVNGDDNRILHRLARLLAVRTGWSLGESPNNRADINYFLPYLDMPAGFSATRAAGWFTHRDTSIKGKASMWDTAAKALNLRTTSARMYVDGLSKHGPTAYVTPPLDREKFRPVKQPKGKRPTIGVSGYTYRGGRKGEALVKQLLTSPLGARINLLAAGRGWPAATVQYEWSRMQEFYQNLDAYLLTSTIEGIGYGPLEALACGVPVVIPEGVGVMDELSTMPGIWRYKVGDFESMRWHLEQAIGAPFDPDDLRAATERFTAEAWCDDHLRAFEMFTQSEAVSMPAIAEPLLDYHGRSGAYVVAYGEPSRKCARRCLRTIKEQMPDLPVCLVSDAPLNAGESIFVQQPDSDIGARGVKIKIFDLAPKDWQYIVYLDADTELVGSIDAMLRPLQDDWDACFTQNPAKDGPLWAAKRPDNHTEWSETISLYGIDQMMQLNGGVFSFRRSDRTKAFFERWYAEWNRYGARDQLALMRTLLGMPLRIWLLSRHFNAVDRYGELGATNAIRHWPMEARRWSGIINGRLDSKEAWAKVTR